MDKIISSITNILNIDDEILTKFLGYMGHRTKRILRIERKEYQTY